MIIFDNTAAAIYIFPRRQFAFIHSDDIQDICQIKVHVVNIMFKIWDMR